MEMSDDEAEERDEAIDYLIGEHTCVRCGLTFPEEEIEYGPDPFSSEIMGDDTEGWECSKCHAESADEI